MDIRKLERQILVIAKRVVKNDDVSHDIHHLHRVMELAKKIGKREGGDLEIILPAALFHDIVVYPKYDPRSLTETEESAAAVSRILRRIKGYPKEKIPGVA